jgi:hypothetical protein
MKHVDKNFFPDETTSSLLWASQSPALKLFDALLAACDDATTLRRVCIEPSVDEPTLRVMTWRVVTHRCASTALLSALLQRVAPADDDDDDQRALLFYDADDGGDDVARGTARWLASVCGAALQRAGVQATALACARLDAALVDARAAASLLQLVVLLPSLCVAAIPALRAALRPSVLTRVFRLCRGGASLRASSSRRSLPLPDSAAVLAHAACSLASSLAPLALQLVDTLLVCATARDDDYEPAFAAFSHRLLSLLLTEVCRVDDDDGTHVFCLTLAM